MRLSSEVTWSSIRRGLGPLFITLEGGRTALVVLCRCPISHGYIQAGGREGGATPRRGTDPESCASHPTLVADTCFPFALSGQAS